MSQDVQTFTDYVASESARLGLPPDLIRAKIVGRWPDGTPLTLSPERPDAMIADNRRRANDFLYQDNRIGGVSDTDGYGCPLGAHIRRSNPRDALPGGGERTMRHRIIRRGMPYGSREARANVGWRSFASARASATASSSSSAPGATAARRSGLVSERDPLLQQGEPGQLSGMVDSTP